MTATAEMLYTDEVDHLYDVEAAQTLAEIRRRLDERLDLEAIGHALRRHQPGQPVYWPNYERTSHYSGNPARFYKSSPDDLLGVVTPSSMQSLVHDHHTFGDSLLLDKREDEQNLAHTFKVRGSMMAALRLAQENPEVRVFTTASAGNHAMGVLVAARVLNNGLVASGQVRLDPTGKVHPDDQHLLYRPHIYCAESISTVKYQRLVDNGAEVDNSFPSLEAAMVAAEVAGHASDAYMIHPFDDETVAAGQATVGLELLFDLKDQGVDLLRDDITVRVPIGGGGLFAGIASVWEWAKAEGLLNPETRLVGVEMKDCDSAFREVSGNTPLTLETMDKDAEGLATLQAGRKTLPVIKEFGAHMAVVPKEYVVRATAWLLEAHNDTPPELAAVVSLASAMHEAEQSYGFATHSRAVHVTLTTGDNVAPSMLSKNCAEFISSPDWQVAGAARRLGQWVFRHASRQQLEWARVAEADDPSVVLADGDGVGFRSRKNAMRTRRPTNALVGHVLRP